MPKTLSTDLRERIVRHVGEGHSRRSAAEKFAVSPSSAVRIVARHAATGSVATKVGRVGRRSKLDAHRDYLVRRIAEAADITMPELAAELSARGCGSIRPICRAGSSGTATASKKTLLASEQDRPDVRQARNEWLAKRQPKMRLERHRLVFVDETSTSTKMTRLRGRCAKGQRLKAKAPFGHWKTQTFVAGLRCHGLTAPFVVDRPMNRRIFETYVETQLAPTLQKGDVVILDNLRAHKSPVAERRPGTRRLDPVPASLQSRPQSDRNGLRQTQGTSAQEGGPNHRGLVGGDRRHLRPVLTCRMQKLLQGSRL